MLKYIAFVSFCAGAALTGFAQSQVWVTGQAARAVLGQPYFTAQITSNSTVTTDVPPVTTYTGATNTVFGAMGGVAYAGNRLFVTDANRIGLQPNNSRAMIFNNIGQTFPAANAEIPPFSGRCPVCGGIASVILGDLSSTGEPTPTTTRTGLNLPAGVASDGGTLAIADTSNNRILIWKTIPANNHTPADLVLGQADFVTLNQNAAPTASSMRSPQGVWIQNGKLYVADALNNRILIWNSMPTVNNQPADLVLGQPNFTTAPNPGINPVATQYNLLNPTSVTTDGKRLFVSDLGFNRVLVWNSLPTQNGQGPDVVIGQPSFGTSLANNVTGCPANGTDTVGNPTYPTSCVGGSAMCQSNGNDSSGNPTYPQLCAATLSFPRFVLTDGTSLYIADGGNDRVLIFNTVPTANGTASFPLRADVILGQPDEFSLTQSSTNNLVQSAADATPTPTSLAWDPLNQNLYVADPTNYRILIFSKATPVVLNSGFVNAASRAVFANGAVIVGGTIRAEDVATITIGTTNAAGVATTAAYNYTVLSTDTTDTIAQGLAKVINNSNGGTGDPNVFTFEEPSLSTIVLFARAPGVAGNAITLATSIGTNDQVTLTPSGANLTGGASAAQVAPGTLLLISAAPGASLASSMDSRPLNQSLPYSLANVEVYFDGMRAPIYQASKDQLGVQIPYEVLNANSVSAWVRIVNSDGSVTVTNPVGIPILSGSPGIFACAQGSLPSSTDINADVTTCPEGGAEPRAAILLHTSKFATAVISVAGSAQAGDTASLSIGGAGYAYNVQASDTLDSIRDALIDTVNADPNSPVSAQASASNLNIILTAKSVGVNGSGINIATLITSVASNNSGPALSLTANTSSTCCFATGDVPSLVTPDNPAIPGETLAMYTTGLGLIQPYSASQQVTTGSPYHGPVNSPRTDVAVTADSGTAIVLSAGLKYGFVGIYEVVFQLSSAIAPNPTAQLTVSQGISTSNIASFPVNAPAATHFNVNPATATVAKGTALSFSVFALDKNNNPVQNYNGTIHVTSSDGAATLPADLALSAGGASFAVTFATTGQQTITVTDTTTGITGTTYKFTVQ